MTETSPIVTVARPPAGVDEGEEHWAYRTTQGRMVPWTEIRLSEGAGEIEARGPWVAARYYEDPSGDDKFTDDGWLRTGDIGELDEQGFVRITDRSKDLIKSGGEWISSVEVETLLIDHPAVLEAAVIAMPDEKWGERPLACVALAEGAGVSPADLREHLSSGLARWQLPDAFAFIDEVPKTSVGKFDKKVLRRRWPRASSAVERSEAMQSASRRQRRGSCAPPGATRPGGRRPRRPTARRRRRARRPVRATRATARPTRGPSRAPARRARPRRARRATADRADARRARAMLGAHPERAPHRIGVGVHPRLVGDLGECDLLAAGQRDGRRERDVARLARELVQLERGREGRAHDRHVGLAGQQPRVGVGEGEVADLELDLGVALGERAQQPRRRGQAGGRAQADGQAPGRAVGVAVGRWRWRGRPRPAPRAPAAGSPRPPRSVRTLRVVRSKSLAPTSVSSWATPALSACCTTLTRAAARVKFSSSASGDEVGEVANLRAHPSDFREAPSSARRASPSAASSAATASALRPTSHASAGRAGRRTCAR